jgi:predicted nucleic acid-binding protein
MPVALIDSNILIDYKDTSPDSRHELAAGIVQAIDRGDLPTARVTNYVLVESLNWIHQR